MKIIDNLLIILAILIISVAISIFLTYKEEYKETILIITSISGTLLSVVAFLRNNKGKF